MALSNFADNTGWTHFIENFDCGDTDARAGRVAFIADVTAISILSVATRKGFGVSLPLVFFGAILRHDEPEFASDRHV